MSKGNRRTNKRPPLRLSTLRRERYTLPVQPGEKTSVVCPDCDTWRLVERHMIKTHRTVQRDRADERLPRCPGSGQLIDIDVDAADWQHWMTQRVRRMKDGMDAGARSGTTLVKKPAPKAPALTGQRTTDAPAAAHRNLNSHKASCVYCGPGHLCDIGRQLTNQVLRLVQPATQRRAAEWRRVQPSVRRADAARLPDDTTVHRWEPSLPR